MTGAGPPSGGGRIERALAGLAARQEKALALFVTAGFPNLDSTPEVVRALEDGGTDLVEIGMPFSDPLADGPAIQQSSQAALAGGITLARILSDVAAIRKRSSIPLVLMGYLNPILRYGTERFFSDAAAAGVDGMILPEVPLEEGGRFAPPLASHHLSQILLVTPSTPPDRIQAIDAASSGFLYCVSTTGVTGQRRNESAAEYLRSVKRHASKNRVLIGFGISTPEDARMFSPYADGIIVGSALIRRLGSGEKLAAVSHWVREMKAAMASSSA